MIKYEGESVSLILRFGKYKRNCLVGQNMNILRLLDVSV